MRRPVVVTLGILLLIMIAGYMYVRATKLPSSAWEAFYSDFLKGTGACGYCTAVRNIGSKPMTVSDQERASGITSQWCVQWAGDTSSGVIGGFATMSITQAGNTYKHECQDP